MLGLLGQYFTYADWYIVLSYPLNIRVASIQVAQEA